MVWHAEFALFARCGVVGGGGGRGGSGFLDAVGDNGGALVGGGSFVVITLILCIRFCGSFALLPCCDGSAEAVGGFLDGFAGCGFIVEGGGGSGSRGGCTRLPCCRGGGLDAVGGFVGTLSGFGRCEFLVATVFFPSGGVGSDGGGFALLGQCCIAIGEPRGRRPNLAVFLSMPTFCTRLRVFVCANCDQAASVVTTNLMR